MRRRAYRATDVKDVLVEEVIRNAPEGAATAGVDIGKYEVRAVVRWKDGSFERPWKTVPKAMRTRRWPTGAIG